jgi:predicted component of type VI protein secretion system
VRTFEVAIADVCSDALEGATVRIEQFTGQWTPLDDEQRMGLGTANHALGTHAVLGTQCYDRGGRAVIAIGPLGENFRRFLTDGDVYPRLVEVLTLLREEPIAFELDLVLSDTARLPFVLGRASGGRIGVDAWVSSHAGTRVQTRLRVPLPMQLPAHAEGFDRPWQSKPQR